MKNEYYSLLIIGIFIGLLTGIYLQSHHPGFFRSWDEDNTRLYRGDKISLHLPEPHATFYRGCEATYLAGQAVTNDNVAWVILQNCAFQKPGFNGPGSAPFFGEVITETFSLRYLDRIK